MSSGGFSGWGFAKVNPSGDYIDKLWLGNLMNSAGDRKNFGEPDLPWLLAEDNPVISPCGE